MSQSIQKSWGCWKIQAEEENIEVVRYVLFSYWSSQIE